MSAQGFGLEIRLLREQRQLSAKDLAERVGLSPSQMSRLESGQRRVDAILLQKIARALDVQPSYFFQQGEPEGLVVSAGPSADGGEDEAQGASTATPAGLRDAALPGLAEGETTVATPLAHLGVLVRAERRRRHLTAEELAQRIGKGKSFVLDVESGSTDLVTGEVLARIARALKLDPELLLDAQRQEIRDLRRSLRRLERAHTERTLGELRDGAPPPARHGIPLIEAAEGGLPRSFDKDVPEGRVVDYLFVPGLRLASGFAVTWRGSDMRSACPPSFEPGEMLVFAADREARHKDFVLAVLQGESLFRRLFLEPKGRVRLQPLDLDHAPRVLERDEVRELLPLVARLQPF